MIVNIGKWVLRNLFIGFILEEQRRHSKDGGSQLDVISSLDVLDPNRIPSLLDPPKLLAVNSCTVVSSLNMIPAVAPIVSPTARSSPLLTPLIPLHHPWKDSPSALSSIPQSPMPLDITPTPISVANQRIYDGSASSVPTPNVLKDDYFARTRLPSMQGNASDDFSGWSGPVRQDLPTPSTPGGLMGRLKNFGKLTKKPTNDTPNISTPEFTTTAVVGTPAPPSVSLI